MMNFRIYDNSPTDNWPTRQLCDSNFSPTTNSPTRPLADTTSHRQFFLKTHRHSPTLTDRAFPRKGVKRNISYNVNIALFSTFLSIHKYAIASFSLHLYVKQTTSHKVAAVTSHKLKVRKIYIKVYINI